MKAGFGTRLALALCLGLPAAACGASTVAGGGSPAPSVPAATSPAASPSGVLCADAAALRASLDRLIHVSVNANTANEITSNVARVQADLTTLVNDARGQWEAQTSALTSALGTLKTATQNLTASPGAGTVTGVLAAIGEVKTAGQSLFEAVSTSCPTVSPSPGQ